MREILGRTGKLANRVCSLQPSTAKCGYVTGILQHVGQQHGERQGGRMLKTHSFSVCVSALAATGLRTDRVHVKYHQSLLKSLRNDLKSAAARGRML